MPMTAEEHEYRTALLATMRRIADALDEIAGTLAAMWDSTKESEAKDD